MGYGPLVALCYSSLLSERRGLMNQSTKGMMRRCAPLACVFALACVFTLACGDSDDGGGNVVPDPGEDFGAPAPDIVMSCTPSCANKDCGDDGCGASCGSCAQALKCVANQCTDACPTTCLNVECGTFNGCSCGTCPIGTECSANNSCVSIKDANLCEAVNAECGLVQVGSEQVDCGTCLPNQVCNLNTYKCDEKSCAKVCGELAYDCGAPDGMPECQCGVCVPAKTCEDHNCVDAGCQFECCADSDCSDGNPLTNDSCVNNQCSYTNVADCATAADCNDNKQCTTDTCGGG
jgi:hypothetical protein